MEKSIKVSVLVLLCAFLLMAGMFLHEEGRPDSTEMDDYFIENGQVETASNNIVAAILFDYRGLDTLGEASVLFAAATGVLIALGARKNG